MSKPNYLSNEYLTQVQKEGYQNKVHTSTWYNYKLQVLIYYAVLGAGDDPELTERCRQIVDDAQRLVRLNWYNYEI